MPTDKRLANLIPFKKDSETARMLGRKGGSRMTERKLVAITLNATKNGKYLQNTVIIEKLQPTPEEKVLGWTYEGNLERVKKLSPVAGADNALDFVKALKIKFVEEEAELKRLDKSNMDWEMAERGKNKVPSPFHRDRYVGHIHDYNILLVDFGSKVFGLVPQNNIFVQNNTQVTLNEPKVFELKDILSKREDNIE